MILRIWRAKINPARLEEYRRFERERCLPMLHKQPGFLGVFFLRHAEDHAASLTIVPAWLQYGGPGDVRQVRGEARRSLVPVEAVQLQSEPHASSRLFAAVWTRAKFRPPLCARLI